MIKINLRKAEKINGELAAFISFPYNNEIVALMRSQPIRFWHADSKEWEVAPKYIDEIVRRLSGYEIEMTGEITEEVAKQPVTTPDGFVFKTTPFQHQLDGFLYGLEHDRFLLGDQQGLGKTKQVIDIAVAKKLTKGYKHCLIVCSVNGLKWNWVREIGVHSNEQVHIIGQRGKSIGGNSVKYEDLCNISKLPFFLIINVESLRDARIHTALSNMCKDGTIPMVAIDEVHKCKNPASQQGKAILQLAPETRIAMTGTPLLNTPLDLFIVLKWLGYENHNFYQFKHHFCVMGGYGGYEVVGYRNLSELKERVSDIMLRRLKQDVLDLPEKVYTTEFVDMTAKQAIIYKEIKEVIRSNIDKIKMTPNPLAELIRLRQATGYTGILSSTIQESAKLDRLEELVEELVDSGEKCIVFSNWTDMTDAIMKRLRRFNPALVTGAVKDRTAQCDKFMTDSTCKCIIGTTGAMGTGLTLTAASTVIFMDSPWTRAEKEQAEDRAHRIGTKSTVNIITLVCKDTIDERIEELVAKKGAMADMLVDGKITKNAAEVVDFLLS